MTSLGRYVLSVGKGVLKPPLFAGLFIVLEIEPGPHVCVLS